MSEQAVVEAQERTPKVHNKRQQAVYGKALSEHGLTPKQLAFVTEYVANGGNGTQAVLKAYNTNDPNSAKVLASNMLTSRNVQRALQDILFKQFATPAMAAAGFVQLAHGAEDERVRLRAYESVAKMHGMFKQRSETETTVKVVSITLPTNTGRKVLDVVAQEVANTSE